MRERRACPLVYPPGMPSFRLASGAAFALALAVLGGCVNTDPAVFVAPTLTNPSAAVGMEVLGTTLNGGFELELHLGARASGASSVTIGEFSLVQPDQSTMVLSPLPGLTASPTFPVMVQPNSSVGVAFTFSTGENLLSTAEESTICDSPGGLVVSGVLQDSLQDTSTPVYSAVFQATGCPHN
jgi:hypothetical protein